MAGDALPCTDTLDVANTHGRRAPSREARHGFPWLAVRPTASAARRRCDMDAPRESATEEVARLRGCLHDLASITALPALWTSGEPAQIVSTVLDALLGTLRLGFVYTRLNDPEGGPSIEMVRVAESLQGTAGAREISQAIDSSLGDAPPRWPLRAQV